MIKPWWHHPNHRYVGKHRGTYQFWPRITGMIPFGIRAVKLTPYIDIVGDNKIPNQTTIKFSPLVGGEQPDHNM